MSAFTRSPPDHSPLQPPLGVEGVTVPATALTDAPAPASARAFALAHASSAEQQGWWLRPRKRRS